MKRHALGLRKAGQMDAWRAALQQAHALEEQAQHAPAPGPVATPADPTGGHTGPPVSSHKDDGGLAAPPAWPGAGLSHPAAGSPSQPVRPQANMPSPLTPVSAGPLPADLFSSTQEPASTTAGRAPQAAAATASGQRSRAEATRGSSTASDAGRGVPEGIRREPLRAGTSGASQEGPGRVPAAESSATAAQREAGRAGGDGAGRPTPQGSRPSDPPTPQPDRGRSGGDEASSARPHYWPDSSPEAAPAASPAKAESARVSPTAADVSVLQEQIRAGKQAAVRLKREGRLPEARAALQQAREQERQLAAHEAATEAAAADGAAAEEEGGEEMVEDAFDPDIVAALKGLGWSEQQIRGGMGAGPGRGAGRPAKAAAAGGERGPLEERIRSEKRRAVELKRAGRQQEALAVLREVKQLEKQVG